MTIKKFHHVRKKSGADYGLTELNVAQSLDNGFMSHNDWVGHGARYGFAMKFISKLGAGEYILDVGCGGLNLVHFLWRNRCPFRGTYVGLDLRATEAWLEKIKTMGSGPDVHLVRMDIIEDCLPPSLPLPDVYPVVTCFEVLEHVPRVCAPLLMDRLHEWTAPGGVCLLSSPNYGNARSVAANHIGKDGEIREWTYEGKVRLAEKAGFTVEASYGSFTKFENLPKEFLSAPQVAKAREFLMSAMFLTWAAAAYPEESLNATLVLRKGGGA